MYMYQGFLANKTFVRKVFVPDGCNDHEHCNMCGDKFMGNEDPPKYGFGSIDGIGWICESCFSEFKKEYNWHELKKVPSQSTGNTNYESP